MECCSETAETSFVKDQNEEDDDSNISSEGETTPPSQDERSEPRTSNSSDTNPHPPYKVKGSCQTTRETWPCSIAQLVAGVNYLGQVSSKRMKLEEKDREALLQFRRVEAERNPNQEEEMAQFYLMMTNQQTTPFVQHQNVTI